MATLTQNRKARDQRRRRDRLKREHRCGACAVELPREYERGMCRECLGRRSVAQELRRARLEGII